MNYFGWAYTIAVAVAVVLAFAFTLPELLRAPKLPPRRKLRLRWEPHDIWVGVYREPETRRTFICPLPGVLFVLEPDQTTGG